MSPPHHATVCVFVQFFSEDFSLSEAAISIPEKAPVAQPLSIPTDSDTCVDSHQYRNDPPEIGTPDSTDISAGAGSGEGQHRETSSHAPGWSVIPGSPCHVHSSAVENTASPPLCPVGPCQSSAKESQVHVSTSPPMITQSKIQVMATPVRIQVAPPLPLHPSPPPPPPLSRCPTLPPPRPLHSHPHPPPLVCHHSVSRGTPAQLVQLPQIRTPFQQIPIPSDILPPPLPQQLSPFQVPSATSSILTSQVPAPFSLSCQKRHIDSPKDQLPDPTESLPVLLDPRSYLSEDDPVSPLPSYPLFDGFCEPSQELPSTSASPDSTEGATSNGPADAPKQVSSDFKSVVQKLRLHLMTHHTSTRSRNMQSKPKCYSRDGSGTPVLREKKRQESNEGEGKEDGGLVNHGGLDATVKNPNVTSKKRSHQPSRIQTNKNQDQPRRLSARKSKPVYRYLVDLETPKPNAENIQQANYTSVCTLDGPAKVHKETGKKSYNQPSRNQSDKNQPEKNQPPKGQPGKNRRHKNQCEVCGRVLSSASSLEHHQRVHRGERPFVCDVCGKAFPDGKGFRRHLLIHTEDKLHRCSQCGKTFVYRFHLTSHQVTHTGERPFPCSVCGKRLTTKSTLAAHTRLHTGEKPFSCDLCGRTFMHRKSFNTHMQRHRGERRYVCLTCNKRFQDLNHLKAHKRIHTGERPYKCKMCGKRFIQSGHLKKHAKTQH